MSRWRLVADIGGTNVRLARADATGTLAGIISHPTRAFASFADALHAYLEETGGIEGCEGAALGAAGAIEGDTITLTNHRAWTIRRPQVSSVLAGAPVALVNDLEAVAAALPHLTQGDIEPIGTTAPHDSSNRTMLALNVGTGLGAAVATHRGGDWLTLPSEAGHITLGHVDGEEREVLEAGATLESLLSGPGIAHAYERLSGTGGAIEAAQVMSRAGTDPNAARVLRVVTGVLGRVAGDLVLATGAWGGVYLCGSVATGWLACADRTRFRAAFESKGPMRERMQRTPTALVCRDNVALFGLSRMRIET